MWGNTLNTKNETIALALLYSQRKNYPINRINAYNY